MQTQQPATHNQQPTPMISEELEFRISQYADGSLPAADAVALEAALANDSEARAMLAEYRRLDGAMKRELALPVVNWDRLAGHLSDAVAAADERQQSNFTLRIGSGVSIWGRLAIAAMVLVAVGSAAWLGLRPARSTNVAIKPSLVQLAEITGPRAEAANRPAVEEVAIGPSASAGSVNYAVAEDIVYRTPRVVIASSRSDRQDSSPLPY